MEKKAIYQIKNLNHSIMRYCFLMGKFKENMPTPAQMQILNYINSKKGEKVYQRDIAITLKLRRATLSEILKTMERNNLISKVSDKTDTRIKQIIISKTAKEKFKEVTTILDNAEKTITQNIDSKDLETFFQVISKMEENLKNERMNIC